MRSPTPLPLELRNRPFRVADAEGLGLSLERLRREDLARPTWGVRELRPDGTVLGLAVATALALPDDIAFSHLTAARLLDLPTPSFWDPTEPLDVMRTSERSRIRRHGCLPHKGLERRRVVHRHGLAVVTPEDTWCDLAAQLSLEDLIVLGDAVVHHRRGLPLDQLEAAVQRHGRSRGAGLISRAMPQLRPRSNSPTETITRLMFLRGGLPEPELNAVVNDRQSGQWLSESDFVWRRQRVVAEYDGDDHRTDKRRWRSDQARRENLVADGWGFVLLTAADIEEPRRHFPVERVRRMLATAEARLAKGLEPWD